MRRRSFLGVAAATAATSALGAAPSGAAGRRVASGAGWVLADAPPAAAGSRLVGVAAAGAELAWAVGEQGALTGTPGRPLALRWDGTAWSHTDVGHLGLNGYLRSVSAGAGTGSGSAAWAVGENRDGADRLLRWDAGAAGGGTWRAVRFPGSEAADTALTWVAAGPDGAAWVAGQYEGLPRLLRHDGRKAKWTPPIPSPTVPDAPWRVALSPAGEVYTIGWDIARWDGKRWTVLPPVTGIRLSIADVLPTAKDDIWAAGSAFGVGGPPGKPPSVVLCHFDGTAWTDVDRDTLPFTVGALTCIAGDAQGRPGLIGGWDFWDDSSAHYLRRTDGAWVGERGAANGTDAYVQDLATIPGTTNGAWSVGRTMNTGAADTHFRIERYG